MLVRRIGGHQGVLEIEVQLSVRQPIGEPRPNLAQGVSWKTLPSRKDRDGWIVRDDTGDRSGVQHHVEHVLEIRYREGVRIHRENDICIVGRVPEHIVGLRPVAVTAEIRIGRPMKRDSVQTWQPARVSDGVSLPAQVGMYGWTPASPMPLAERQVEHGQLRVERRRWTGGDEDRNVPHGQLWRLVQEFVAEVLVSIATYAAATSVPVPSTARCAPSIRIARSQKWPMMCGTWLTSTIVCPAARN